MLIINFHCNCVQLTISLLFKNVTIGFICQALYLASIESRKCYFVVPHVQQKLLAVIAELPFVFSNSSLRFHVLVSF